MLLVYKGFFSPVQFVRYCSGIKFGLEQVIAYTLCSNLEETEGLSVCGLVIHTSFFSCQQLIGTSNDYKLV